MKRVLITGVTGQDGRYLSEQLIDRGYEVYGTIRRSTNPARVPYRVKPFERELADVPDVIRELKPWAVCNLAAFTHVGKSFECPRAVAEVNGNAVQPMLEACLRVGARFYQASTSELFGNAPAPQSESTPMQPVSPYGIAKLTAYWWTRYYRETYGLRASNGILFNHESPLRGRDFVTRKIAKGVARIAAGDREPLVLGDLSPRRDWGHAADYMRAVVMMLEADESDDYVVATGESHSVEEFVAAAFKRAGVDDWNQYVKHGPNFVRAREVSELRGDASKIARALDWVPRKGFDDVVAEMVAHEMAVL